MAEGDQNDPFLWEVDRVVQELCTSNRSWIAPSAKRMPDPVLLEIKLREKWVDGESLLKYADFYDVAKLWELLDLKIAPHQLSISEAIEEFRRRSPKYRAWVLSRQKANHPDANAAPSLPAATGNRSASVPMSDVQQDPVPNTPLSGKETDDSNDSAGSIALPEDPPPPEKGPAQPSLEHPSLTTPDIPTPPTSEKRDADVSVAENDDSDDAPKKKKRRIAPITTTTVTNQVKSRYIPTEADIFMKGTPREILSALDPHPAYLGRGILQTDLITEAPIADDPEETPQEFGWVRPKGIPLGRRLQVSRAMKKRLRSDHFAPGRDSHETEEDKILPLYGEGEHDEEFDPETLKQILEDEESDRRLEAEVAKERLLSQDEAKDVIQSTIQKLEEEWASTKKPKHDRKAWKIWQDARRHHSRLHSIVCAERQVQHLDVRIASIEKQILRTKWSSTAELEGKAADYLEVSIFESQYQKWLIALLESAQEPLKPSMLPKLHLQPKKQAVSYDEDEEVLTSESEDDFIVGDDDYSALVIDNAMDADSEEHPMSDGLVSPQAPEDASVPANVAGNDTSREATPTTPTQPEAPEPVTPALTSDTASEPMDIAPSPVAAAQPDHNSDIEDPAIIGEISAEYWEEVKDNKRLIIAVLSAWSSDRRSAIFDAVKGREAAEVWRDYMVPIINIIDDWMTADYTSDSVMLDLARLFDCFTTCTTARLDKPKLTIETFERITRDGQKDDGKLFGDFCELIRSQVPRPPPPVPEGPPTPQTPVQTDPAPSTPPGAVASETTAAEATETGEDSGDLSDASASSSDDVPPSSAKKRRRRLPRNQEAKDLRETLFRSTEEFAKRRQLLRERLAESGTVPGDKSRLIVNETKESDEQALIYINESIGTRIKDHQIDGVRFMWNQLVAASSTARQGCLLAHEMGLGKTMQVITLLVVIAEASRSPDPSVYSQIPEALRESRTLILCPSGLVDNWIDEILLWAPENLLGPLFKVESVVKARDRAPMIRDWAEGGGVLVIGYPLFSSLVLTDEEIADLLRESPNIVIGDEAHMMKNPDSLRHQTTANFRTMSRIALTGSPLTNKVLDYYSMINWVAPNYLADISEFRDRFEKPIREGLYADSELWQKRRARKQLHVLKAMVEPKVHRKGVQILVNELPRKSEFIITVPLTELQKHVYEVYIRMILEGRLGEGISGQTGIWSLVSALTTLLAHPQAFRRHLLARKEGANQRRKTADDIFDKDPLPPILLNELLDTVPMEKIGDYAHSYKIVLLLRILDECKAVGDKVLVFSHSLAALDYLEELCRTQKRVYQRLDGSTPITERQAATKKFNTNRDSEVYLISTKAGGVGLNIFGANRVVIFDFKYTPADEQQAIGRAYRIGQTKPVCVYWLTVGGTYEDTIHNNSVFKSQLASRVVDKKNPDPWSSKRVGDYFKMPQTPDKRDVPQVLLERDGILGALAKSADLQNVILYVTSTETFEREEQDELTAQEKQEAEEDIAKELQRSQDREEIKRREQNRVSQMRAAGAVATAPQQQLGTPLPSWVAAVTGQPSTEVTGGDRLMNRIIKLMVPRSMRTGGPSAPGSSPAPLANSPSNAGPASGPAPNTVPPAPDSNRQALYRESLASPASIVTVQSAPAPTAPASIAQDVAPAGPASTQPSSDPQPSVNVMRPPPLKRPAENDDPPPPAEHRLPILGTGTFYKTESAPGPTASGSPTSASEASKQSATDASSSSHNSQPPPTGPRALRSPPPGPAASRNPPVPIPGSQDASSSRQHSRTPSGSSRADKTSSGVLPVSPRQRLPRKPNIFISPPGRASGGPSTQSRQADKEAQLLESIKAAYRRALEAGHHPAIKPRNYLSRLNGALDQTLSLGWQRMDKLQNLQKCVRHPRFTEALVAGHIQPEELASQGREQMDDICARYNAMPDEEFKRKVWQPRKDPDQTQKQLHRLSSSSSSGDHDNPGKRKGKGVAHKSSDTTTALQDVVNRRAARPNNEASPRRRTSLRAERQPDENDDERETKPRIVSTPQRPEWLRRPFFNWDRLDGEGTENKRPENNRQQQQQQRPEQSRRRSQRPGDSPSTPHVID